MADHAMNRGGSAQRVLPVFLLVAVAACTSTSSSTATISPTTVAVETTVTTVATTAASAQTTTATQPVDANAAVGESLAASGANYRFASVVMVGGESVTNIGGVVDAGSVAAEIVTGTESLSYVRTAEGEWVTGTDGAWVPLEGEPAPVSPPLLALSDATDLSLESGNALDGVFTGVLGAAAGLAQGIPFSLTTKGGLVSEIRYQVESSAGPAEVTTTLTEIGEAGTVTTPAQ